MNKSIVLKLVAVFGVVGMAFLVGRLTARSEVGEVPTVSPVSLPVARSSEAGTVLQPTGTFETRRPMESSSESKSVQTEPLVQPDPQLDLQQAMAALDEAIRKQRIYEDDSRQFEVKYQGASTDVLIAATKLLKQRLESEQNSIIDDRMKQGLFTETIVEPGELPPTVRPSKKGGYATIGMRQAPNPDGSLRIRTTEILPEEYPEFNSTRMEYWWLKRKTAGTTVAASTPPTGG